MRVVNRIVSALVALALLVGGLLVALEIAAAGIGRSEPVVLPWDDWRTSALDTPWEDANLRLLFIVLAVVGLLLLAFQLVRRRPIAIPMQTDTPGAEADLDRHGLERWLTSKVERVAGVAGARVSVTNTSARVRAETPGRETGAVQQGVAAAANSALSELRLARSLPVKVSVTSRRDDS